MKKTCMGLLAWGVTAGAMLAQPTLAAEQLYTKQLPVTPELAIPGPWTTGVTTMTATNSGQLSAADFSSLVDRQLTLEVWYPAQMSAQNSNQVVSTVAQYSNVTRSGKPFTVQGSASRDAQPVASGEFPLVVLSHGYTGYRTLMFYLGEHLASHGYVVVGIDHTDSTPAEVDHANAPFSGFVSTLLNRARDQQFVLETFAALDSSLGKLVDSENAAVVGYSMGGYGAINTVGGCYNFTSPALQSLGFPAEYADALLPVFNFCNAGREAVDPRWKAMVSFAPWGQELNLHAPQSLAEIDVPSLYVSGDQDDVSGFENGVKALYEQTGAEHNYLMVYQNARHNIAGHPAPQVAFEVEDDIGFFYEPSWSTESLNRVNQHMLLAFLDCHVKDNSQRCGYLPQRTTNTQSKDASGQLSAAWPGFKHRWGLGVDFYRR